MLSAARHLEQVVTTITGISSGLSKNIAQAERLVGIVASAVGGPDAADASELRVFRKRAFEAILDEEASRLRAVPELIARLRTAIAAH